MKKGGGTKRKGGSAFVGAIWILAVLSVLIATYAVDAHMYIAIIWILPHFQKQDQFLLNTTMLVVVFIALNQRR